MRTIQEKICLAIIMAVPFLINACYTTPQSTVSSEDNNTGPTGTAVNYSSQSLPQTQTSDAIKKRDIKRKDDRITAYNQANANPGVNLSETQALDKHAQILLQDRKNTLTMAQLDEIDDHERFRTFKNLREKAIPHDSMIGFTKKEEWDEIKKRTSKELPDERLDDNREHTERLQIIPSPSQNILSQEMKSALNKRLDIEFIETPLSDVIAFINEKTKVNFVVDENAGSSTVTIKLKDVSVSTILSYIIPKDFDYTVRDNVISIIQEPLELRVYDIRDLLINLGDRAGLTSQAGGSSSSSSSDGETRGAFDRVQEIITLITTTIEPDSWTDNGGRGIIAAREGMLGDIVVTHIADVHRQTQGLLSALRSSSDLQVNIEAYFITVTDDFLEEYGHNFGSFDKNWGRGITGISTDPASLTKGTGTILTSIGSGVTTGAAQLSSAVRSVPGTTGLNFTWGIFGDYFMQGFLRAVQENSEAETMSAPNITLSNTQRGTIRVVQTINYVQSYTIVSQQPQPVIAQIDDGTTFNVRPIVSADRKYVTLEVHPELTTVTFTSQSYQTSITTTGGTGTTAATNTIQLPNTVRQELSVTVSVPDKGFLMIGGLGQRNDNETRAGLPILSKIPFIKRLFSRDSKLILRRNLIIFIKPTILIRQEQETNAFGRGRSEIEVRVPSGNRFN